MSEKQTKRPLNGPIIESEFRNENESFFTINRSFELGFDYWVRVDGRRPTAALGAGAAAELRGRRRSSPATAAGLRRADAARATAPRANMGLGYRNVHRWARQLLSFAGNKRLRNVWSGNHSIVVT